MANILYRGSVVPSATNSAGANNGPLTNDQIDKNFFALDSAKFEKSGGTVSGDTTFSTNVTISGNLNVNGNSYLGNVGNVHISGGELNYILKNILIFRIKISNKKFKMILN